MFYGATSAPAIAAGGYYTTSFAGTENPLSETGVWTQGGTVGLDWTNMQKTPGLCFRTQTAHTVPPYDDSIACLSGFSANQYATGVIHRASPTGSMEIELLLHWKISANSARGYEIDIIRSTNLNIVRWNGSQNNFTPLVSNVSTNVNVNDGAVWYAQIVNHVITVKCNGLTCTTYDTTSDGTRWDDGNPGIGAYVDSSLGATTAGNTFCWSSFTASNI